MKEVTPISRDIHCILQNITSTRNNCYHWQFTQGPHDRDIPRAHSYIILLLQTPNLPPHLSSTHSHLTKHESNQKPHKSTYSVSLPKHPGCAMAWRLLSAGLQTPLLTWTPGRRFAAAGRGKGSSAGHRGCCLQP